MIQFTCPCGQALQVQDANAGRKVRCPACGRELDVPGGQVVPAADVPRPVVLEPDEGVRRPRPDRPGGQEGEGPSRPPRTSGMAIASVVLGVLSLVPCCSVLAGLPAILLGALGLGEIGRGLGRVKGEWAWPSRASSPAASACCVCR